MLRFIWRTPFRFYFNEFKHKNKIEIKLCYYGIIKGNSIKYKCEMKKLEPSCGIFSIGASLNFKFSATEYYIHYIGINNIFDFILVLHILFQNFSK